MPLPHPGGAVLYVSTSVGGSFALALERAAFGLNVRKGMARTTTSCRKSETKLSMPMNNLALPHAKMLAPVPPLRTREKSPRKNFPRFKPRNPLKSLESDEEIQDNSTLMTGGLQSEIATSQENPNDRPDQGRDSSPGRSQTESIQMQSGLGRANRRVKCASRKAQLFWQPVRGCPPAPQAFRRVRARALPSR
jgi:hypothetical protein